LTGPSDLPLLAHWFADADFVARWGGRPLARTTIERDYIGVRLERLPDGREERVRCFLIESGDQPIGYIQCWSDRSGEGGLDLVLAPQFQGRGFGADAIRAMVRYVREVLGWRRVTVDPAADNARAIRTFEKCGFVFERDWPDHPDGPSILMVFENPQG